MMDSAGPDGCQRVDARSGVWAPALRAAYGLVLLDLRCRRAELDAAICVLERLVQQGACTDGASRSEQTGGGPFTGLATCQAAMAYLALVQTPMTAQAIARGLAERGWHPRARRPANTVHVALRRLERTTGRVRRLPDGRWRLAAPASDPWPLHWVAPVPSACPRPAGSGETQARAGAGPVRGAAPELLSGLVSRAGQPTAAG